MSTRREILLKARQVNLSPEGRKNYCKQCYENARQNYQAGLILPGAGALGFLGSLGPALVAQLLLGCPQSPLVQHYQAEGATLTPGTVSTSPPSGPTLADAKPGQAPVPALNSARQEYDKKGPAVNPWAVCHASVGAKKTAAFERCVQGVKSKSKIKTH